MIVLKQQLKRKANTMLGYFDCMKMSEFIFYEGIGGCLTIILHIVTIYKKPKFKCGNLLKDINIRDSKIFELLDSLIDLEDKLKEFINYYENLNYYNNEAKLKSLGYMSPKEYLHNVLLPNIRKKYKNGASYNINKGGWCGP